jgi:hypothetical protein
MSCTVLVLYSVLDPSGFQIFMCARSGKLVDLPFDYGHKTMLSHLRRRETEKHRRLLAAQPVCALAFPYDMS